MAKQHIINNDNTINKKAVTRVIWSILRAVILIEVCFVILYPLLYTLSVAFRPPVELNDPVIVWIPKTLTISNVTQIWAFIDFPTLIMNTIKIDLVSSIIQTIVCCIVGYGFARFDFKFKNLMFMLVLLSIIIPPQATTISNFIQFRDLRILDTPWVFYLPAATANGIRAGLYIFIFKQFFRNMPIDLEDAAYIDGAGPFKTFLRIMLPNASSPIIIVFLFSLVWYWNDTFYSGMYLDRMQTISTSLETLRNNLSIMLPGIQVDPFTMSAYLQSGVILSIAPILIIYIILQKYFTQSIERTGLVS